MSASLSRRRCWRSHFRSAEATHVCSIPEACKSLGVDEAFFRAYILPEIKVVRVGRRTIIPVVEIYRWLERPGARLSLG
jgi:hypothetical protein